MQRSAPRRPLEVNSSLYEQAERLGLDASRIAEAALTKEIDRRRKEQIEGEIQQDLAALDAYSDEHGSFAEHVRAHYSADEQ